MRTRLPPARGPPPALVRTAVHNQACEDGRAPGMRGLWTTRANGGPVSSRSVNVVRLPVRRRSRKAGGSKLQVRRGGRDESVYDYDLLVIGSGPGGQKAAIGAA